ncbi:MAG: DUF697 domain-containing protein [Verrucomicrobiales bacterium]|nr:DUF697 domain-containing protein [Verrucomicrobiales bacterium]
MTEENFSNITEETDQAATTAVADCPTPQNPPVRTELEEKAHQIVKDHVLCSMGAGLIPIPLVDIASVTAIQVDALKKLAGLHGVDITDGNAKAIATGLAGSTLARLGASAIKLVPGVGTVAGGLTMAGLSGASTYAICQVAQNHFKTRGTFLDFNATDAKEAYAVALEKGKEMVKKLEVKKDEAVAKFEEMQKLQQEKMDSYLNEKNVADSQSTTPDPQEDQDRPV